MRTLIAIAAAALMAGCMTTERAASYSDAQLCYNLYDQFSFTGNTERILVAEVARRGISCGGPAWAAAPEWTKPGATASDYQSAAARCRMNAAMLPREPTRLTPPPNPGAGMVQLGTAMRDVAAEKMFMDDCMLADGWRRGGR